MPTSALSALRALDDPRHRAELYRMWGSGHSAGLTHPASLEAMGPRESAGAERVRQWLLGGTSRGAGVADVVRAGGDRFEDFERSLLAFGDEAGRLDDALRLLGDFYTRKHRLLLWVRKQLAYPLVTGLAACFIAPLPLLFLGQAAAYVLTALAGVTLGLAASGGLVAAVAAAYGRRPPLARARMARALATGIQAGLPLPRALRLAADASAHPEIQAHVRRATDRQLGTSSLGDSLAACPHLTPDFLAVLTTAETTGDFSPLARLADLYEDGFR